MQNIILIKYKHAGISLMWTSSKVNDLDIPLNNIRPQRYSSFIYETVGNGEGDMIISK